MYTSFYGMSENPFIKENTFKYKFECTDFLEVYSRLEYLKEIKGIGLFVGAPGLGKSYLIKCFIDSINKDLYKVVYISATKEMTVFDFYKCIANNFSLDTGACYKSEIYDNIQKEIIRVVEQDKMSPIVFIDEAQNLSRDILFNLKVLTDFVMDSKINGTARIKR